MKIFLKKAIFVNKAPFDKIELNFSENEIGVLSAVNGRGKTTILSHIVDAFYEMARKTFAGEFEGRKNKFYRVSSNIYSLNPSEPSFVYLRFEIRDSHNREIIDYLEMKNNYTQKQYDKAVDLPDKIPFNDFKSKLSTSLVKMTSNNLSKQKIEKLFQNNLLTYFPSYRYEQPGYLSESYKIKLDFNKTLKFSGFLNNPIEVVTRLPELANWIMDIVLDLRQERQKELIIMEGGKNPFSQILPIIGHEKDIWNNLNKVIEKILISKNNGTLRFGIGPRQTKINRIGVFKEQNNQTQLVYPNIFNLSSSEASLLCLFGELLRQADNNKANIQLQEITGIVLIDEIDKHLHIKLQKEVLPELLKMFPNVQFITSSHSPFVSMGLAENLKDRSKIIDLDNFGISQDPTTNEQYKEVYNMMINENERFKDLYESLEKKLKNGTKPMIITEGKTDVKHIKKAKEKLNITDCDFEFFGENEDRGDDKLQKILEYSYQLKPARKIIGIFDRDNQDIINKIEKNGNTYKNYGNNVYAFCLPIPKDRKGYKNISIEFYYSDNNLKKEKNGKRLYFDNEVEFKQSASNKKDRKLCKLEEPKQEEEFSKKILDEEFDGLDWIHSKSVFARLVETDENFISDFDFSNFQLIFDKIKEILNIDT